jgi:hypothetical protein
LKVTVRIIGAANHASASRKGLPFAQVAGNDIAVNSPLPESASLNEHLVRLWGMLKHERRFLKSLQAEGATITVEASGGPPFEIAANGAEMLHLLGANLVVKGK